MSIIFDGVVESPIYLAVGVTFYKFITFDKRQKNNSIFADSTWQ